MQVNVEMDDVTKKEDPPTIKFVQPSRTGWWIVCIFRSWVEPALKCFYFCLMAFMDIKLWV